jgi:hypothetical protein
MHDHQNGSKFGVNGNWLPVPLPSTGTRTGGEPCFCKCCVCLTAVVWRVRFRWLWCLLGGSRCWCPASLRSLVFCYGRCMFVCRCNKTLEEPYTEQRAAGIRSREHSVKQLKHRPASRNALAGVRLSILNEGKPCFGVMTFVGRWFPACSRK